MKTPAAYLEYSNKRASFSEKVLASSSTKIIVMAGPGTGKSFLFKQVANKYISEGKKNILVLTFINELVKDLTVEMHGLAEVSTLHSFAARELGLSQQIYMDTLEVVATDFEIETNEKKDFDLILHNLDVDETQAIEYLRKRRDYYECIDPASMVFELVNYFSIKQDKIPEFDLILVDEYQDFNLLEIELINLLGTKSNILIAGDDDQSLYSFKHSVPENIRDKHKSGEYDAFQLPYCSRSTEVVIKAFHDVVDRAKSEGCLNGRIEKQYLYFHCEKKDRMSEKHPKISVRKNTQQTQNAFYINSEIITIFQHDPKFDVLVICPLRSQLATLGAALRKKGYNNVLGDEAASDRGALLADGLKYLVINKDSNLGWRLCAEALLSDQAFKETLLKTVEGNLLFMNAVPAETKAVIKSLRAAAAKLHAGDNLSKEQQELLFDQFNVPIAKLGEINVRDKIFGSRSNKVHHDVKIKLTTILGSKGLSYDYVFMVNFDDKYLVPKTGINDESVNKFLVALTRSKNKINIFTSQKKEPTFVSWIADDKKTFI